MLESFRMYRAVGIPHETPESPGHIGICAKSPGYIGILEITGLYRKYRKFTGQVLKHRVESEQLLQHRLQKQTKDSTARADCDLKNTILLRCFFKSIEVFNLYPIRIRIRMSGANVGVKTGEYALDNQLGFFLTRFLPTFVDLL